MLNQHIIPSLVAKNQNTLDIILKKLKGATKHVHLDIVDGRFAANHSLDFNFKLHKSFTYSAHVMTKHPERWIQRHLNAIDLFIPQSEAIRSKKRYIQWVKSKKKKIAFALKPETSVHTLKPYIKYVDYVLILTVRPGFYGSLFLRAPLQKIKQIKRLNKKIKVFVDGHMNPQTVKEARKAGADYIICGSYILNASKPKVALKTLSKALS